MNSAENEVKSEGKKRVFILLGMVMMLCYFAVFGVIWLLMTSSSPALKQFMVTGFVALFICTFLAMGAGMTFLVIGFSGNAKNRARYRGFVLPDDNVDWSIVWCIQRGDRGFLHQNKQSDDRIAGENL